MGGLAGRVALVTGATAGIGRAVALRLAQDGACVVVNGRGEPAGKALVEVIKAAGGEAMFAPGDARSPEQMAAVAKSALARYGQVDIVVASAGGVVASQEGAVSAGKGRLFHQLSAPAVVDKLGVSVLAKINPALAVIDHMIQRETGNILFITSEGGRSPTRGQSVTALASGGLLMLAKVAAKELAAHRIRVNALAVTLVRDTPSWDLFASGASDRAAMYEKIVQRAPFGIASPENIADVAAFLVSDQAAFITGATVSPTGGLTY